MRTVGLILTAPVMVGLALLSAATGWIWPEAMLLTLEERYG
jgi:hypothetical protein